MRADLLLLLTAFIWGTAFVAQKIANEKIGPATFVGARFLISALALLPFYLFERKKQKISMARRDKCIALIVAACLLIGALLQQIGMLTTTATHAGFLTALYVVLVPFVVWLITRRRPKILVVAACLISVLGAYLLAGNGIGSSFAIGDVMMIIADFAWAIGISLVPIFLNSTNRPYFLSFLQFSITGILSLCAGFMFESVNTSAILSVWPSLLYAAIISGSIAYTMQIIGQKHTPAAEAAIILSLESVFAAIAGAIILGERLTTVAMVGCSFILCGVMLVEIGQALVRLRSRS